MVDVDVHGSVQGADQHRLVGPQSFMSPVDRLGLPVRPVDVLLKQGHGEDVGDVLHQDCKDTQVSSKQECFENST